MSSNCFSKDFRLLTSGDFNYLKQTRQVVRKKFLSAYFKDSRVGGQLTRIGISVSKKVGKSNFRNCLKRIIREEFRTSPYRHMGTDISFVVTTRCKVDDKKQFRKMILEILKDIEKNDIK